jgi:hypothetical protein
MTAVLASFAAGSPTRLPQCRQGSELPKIRQRRVASPLSHRDRMPHRNTCPCWKQP